MTGNSNSKMKNLWIWNRKMLNRKFITKKLYFKSKNNTTMTLLKSENNILQNSHSNSKDLDK